MYILTGLPGFARDSYSIIITFLVPFFFKTIYFSADHIQIFYEMLTA